MVIKHILCRVVLDLKITDTITIIIFIMNVKDAIIIIVIIIYMIPKNSKISMDDSEVIITKLLT